MSFNYPYNKNIGIMCARAATGNLGGVIKAWQYLPQEKHPHGLEGLLGISLIIGAPRTFEALMTVHGMHPEIKINESGYFTYKPSSDNGTYEISYLEKGTPIYKTKSGLSLVNPQACKSLEEYGNNYPERIQGSTNFYTFLDKIYGNVTQKLIHNLRSLHPHIENTILQFGYGNLFNRQFCNTLDSEICAVCAAIPLGPSVQLFSHIRGSLLNGFTETEISDLTNTLYTNGDISFKKYNLAKNVLKKVVQSTELNSKM